MIQSRIDNIKPKIKSALIIISHTSIANVECLFVEKRGYGFGTGVIFDVLGDLYFSEDWEFEPADVEGGRVISFPYHSVIPFEKYCKKVGI